MRRKPALNQSHRLAGHPAKENHMSSQSIDNRVFCSICFELVSPQSLTRSGYCADCHEATEVQTVLVNNCGDGLIKDSLTHRESLHLIRGAIDRLKSDLLWPDLDLCKWTREHGGGDC